ncbi:MAG: outer membrane beta-barrel protein [Candidatus Omnitrophota bacterium]
MKSLILKTACLILVAMMAQFGVAFADENEVVALKNELQSMKSDLADLKGQIHSMQNKAAPAAPAYVAPSKEAGQGLLHIAQDINMGGWVDVQWNQNFNDGYKKNSNNTLRSFDNRKDSFTVNQALLWFEKPVTDVGQAGFKIDMLMGEDARNLASDGSDADAFDLMTAYVEYKASLCFLGDSEMLPDWVDIKVGRMLTLAGVENPYAPYNWEVSRGFMFNYAVPTHHTGIRTNFKVWQDKLDVYFGINNGWDQAVDTNSEKMLEFGLGYQPTSDIKVMHSMYLGQETAGGAANDLASNRFLTSNVVQWNATEKLSLAGEIDYGTSRGAIKHLNDSYDDGNWFGLGAHSKYQWTDKFAPFYRIEWMTDQHKTRLLDNSTDPTRTGNGYADSVLGNTFGAEYKVTDNLITRGEYRWDKASGTKAYDGSFSQEQTLEGQVIYLIG